MNEEIDFEYTRYEEWTTFYPFSNAGYSLYCAEIAPKTDGTGSVFNCHAQETIAQLRQAGYTVREVVYTNPKPDEQILAALGIHTGGELNVKVNY